MGIFDGLKKGSPFQHLLEIFRFDGLETEQHLIEQIGVLNVMLSVRSEHEFIPNTGISILGFPMDPYGF